MKLFHVALLSMALAFALAVSATAETARGVVYHDKNSNGQRDRGEKGVSGVLVSNGEDVVRTRRGGAYTLPVDGDTILFVIKPSGWRTALDAQTRLPRFYYIHKPEGSPALKYGGVAPTGPLPQSVDFPLYRQKALKRFRMICFGDTQPRNQKEVDYVSHDVVEELIGVEAAFGVTLGDLVFDGLDILEPIASSIGVLGLPWYHVLGNHDMNYDAPTAELADETYARVFGPSYYAYTYGDVHFLVLNDVFWEVDNQQYHAELGVRQRTFIQNFLEAVPRKDLVVLMMHIPLPEVTDRAELFQVLARRPNTFSLSAHTHTQYHSYLGRTHGWPGDAPHHHLVHATACGSWWSGAFDELGIPHTTMRDGAPNGYSIISFDGSDYSVTFKAARRPADHQMTLHAPETVAASRAGSTEVVANIFAGSERSVVEMRLGGEGDWTDMTQVRGVDPTFAALAQRDAVFLGKAQEVQDRTALSEEDMKALAAAFQKAYGPGIGDAQQTSHLWKASLPANPATGSRVIYVRTTDQFGQTYVGKRIIRIE